MTTTHFFPLAMNGTFIRIHKDKTTTELKQDAIEARRAFDFERLQKLLDEFEYRHSHKARVARKLVKGFIEEIESKNLRDAEASAKLREALTSAFPVLAASAVLTSATKLMRPTPEQDEAIRLFHAGHSLTIDACAGTGKTSTLRLMAAATQRKGISLSEALPHQVSDGLGSAIKASTSIFDLAVELNKPRFESYAKKPSIRLSPQLVATVLGLKDIRIDCGHFASALGTARLVQDTVYRFQCSPDTAFETRHVPFLRSLCGVSMRDLAGFQAHVLQAARQLWQSMIDSGSPVPLSRSGFLKLWALDEPRIKADFVLLDDAQDCSPMLAHVLNRQDAQAVRAHDLHQALTYWPDHHGAPDLANSRIASLTQPFSFGDVISALASRLLRLMGDETKLQAKPGLRSRLRTISRPDAIIVRNPATALAVAIDALAAGRKPQIAGGVERIWALVMGVLRLKAGLLADVQELIGFGDWETFMAFVSTRSGADLAPLVDLVELHEEDKLFSVLAMCAEPSHSDLTIATVEQSKGRQWRSVRLHEDLLPAGADILQLRSLYVAVTRASADLDVPRSVLAALGIRELKQPAAVRAAPRRTAVAHGDEFVSPVPRTVGLSR